MTALTQAKPQNQEVMLTIVNGPEAGVAYKLMGQSITLGRAPENDVVLQDTKASRTHAMIELRNGQYWISDVGSQNGISVNGSMVRETALKPGDQIIIGSTQMSFGPPATPALMSATPPPPSQALAPRSAGLGAPNPAAMGWLPPLTRQRSQGRNAPSNNIFIVLIGVGLVIFFIMQNAGTVKKAMNLKDEATLQETIENTVESNEKRQQEIMQKGKDTQQYAEAQAFYQRGFREFREANYARAIQNFEAALALYPSHPLAKRYLERSRLKLNEMITASLERGERYFQLQRYNNARSEYQTVIVLSGDTQSKSAQLAAKRLEAIKLIMMNSK